MQSSKPPSFFQDLKTRELNGFKVRKRPHFGDLSSDSGGPGTGVVTIEHDGISTPPLSVSFCKSNRNSHFLAVSDEDGYVSFYDTRRKLPALASCGDNAEARVCDWIAHHNAIFDVCWIKDDTQILTASGDQTIKIWDAEKRKCIGVMMEHTGSVKSLSSHPSNSDLVVSGSRDGSFALWDLRSKFSSTTGCREACFNCCCQRAHVSHQGKRGRRGKAANMSITSVLYLKDEISIASAGAVDSIVKFWDTRNLKASITQTHPHFEPSTKEERRLHGISSLSQDMNGVFLAASCMDNRIYLYNVLQLDKGPVRTFSGSQIESFYVKSAISPDASHILGGSSDGNAYMWQVNNPEVGPVELKGHEGEVTAVDWCSSETGKIATSSDDFMVRIWNIQKGSWQNSRSPSRIRKRITASPTMECERLVEDRPPSLKKTANSPSPSEKTSMDHPSPSHTKLFTPESAEKRRFMGSLLKEELDLQKTPEAEMKSPSSVLNPPPSLKRTIRDYFVVAS
ncbi:denticleless protein isoform X3 [Cinnamomum micranthum f. kanehirae]|uniref:Denticleless protein isoform X3 n=1 Tax=Cinnamomum micranthum f. kanehirae TaxID=337451 RepID=A0A443PTG4_9MAGN|nr:denticleless protein isoform X3 [Cinnamomum micranthum f. kanehirae]